jgi:hypothetical protein
MQSVRTHVNHLAIVLSWLWMARLQLMLVVVMHSLLVETMQLSTVLGHLVETLSLLMLLDLLEMVQIA